MAMEEVAMVGVQAAGGMVGEEMGVVAMAVVAMVAAATVTVEAAVIRAIAR